MRNLAIWERYRSGARQLFTVTGKSSCATTAPVLRSLATTWNVVWPALTPVYDGTSPRRQASARAGPGGGPIPVQSAGATVATRGSVDDQVSVYRSGWGT